MVAEVSNRRVWMRVLEVSGDLDAEIRTDIVNMARECAPLSTMLISIWFVPGETTLLLQDWDSMIRVACICASAISGTDARLGLLPLCPTVGSRLSALGCSLSSLPAVPRMPPRCVLASPSSCHGHSEPEKRRPSAQGRFSASYLTRFVAFRL